MADISHLHPLMQRALRTGEVPEPEELARLMGRNFNHRPSGEGPDSDEDVGPEQFRTQFQTLLDEGITTWLDDHPENGNYVPAEVRERIEADCDRQTKYLLAVQSRSAQEDPDCL